MDESPDAKPNKTASVLSVSRNGAFDAAFSNVLAGATVSDPRIFGFAPGDVLPALEDYPNGFSPAADERFLRSINLPAADGMVFEWIGPEEKRLRNRVDGEPFIPKDSDDASFDSVRLIVNDVSNRIVRVCCHKRVWGLNVPPPDLLVSLAESLFDLFESCETVLDGEMWQSGRIWRVWFFPNDESGVVLSYHEQFGIDLELFRVNGPFRPRGWYYDHRFWESGRTDRNSGRHPFWDLYLQHGTNRTSSLVYASAEDVFGSFHKCSKRIGLSSRGDFPVDVLPERRMVSAPRFDANKKTPESLGFSVIRHGPKGELNLEWEGTIRSFPSERAAFSAMLDRILEEGFPEKAIIALYSRRFDFEDLCLESRLHDRIRVLVLRGNVVMELLNDHLPIDFSGEPCNFPNTSSDYLQAVLSGLTNPVEDASDVLADHKEPSDSDEPAPQNPEPEPGE